MSTQSIILPSKPRIVSEENFRGIYEIDGLAPGYGYTLGNSLRRIILSSLPGAAVTSVTIAGTNHEFSTIEGIKEDVIAILLNIKKIRFKLIGDEAQSVTLSVKGPKKVTAADIETSGQVEVLNPELYICEVTGKRDLSVEFRIEKGYGFVPKDEHAKGKVDIGTIALDAIFTPIRRVSYEVENMRVGDKTDHNRLRMVVETDGTVAPREAFEKSVEIMIEQLRAILDFAPAPARGGEVKGEVDDGEEEKSAKAEPSADVLKTRIETLELSTRVENALSGANIRTLGGLARKKIADLMELSGLGGKGIEEIKDALAKFGISLKE